MGSNCQFWIQIYPFWSQQLGSKLTILLTSITDVSGKPIVFTILPLYKYGICLFWFCDHISSSGYCSYLQLLHFVCNLISNASHQPLHIPDQDSGSHGTLSLFSIALLWKLRDLSTSVVVSGSSLGWWDQAGTSCKCSIPNQTGILHFFHQFWKKYKKYQNGRSERITCQCWSTARWSKPQSLHRETPPVFGLSRYSVLRLNLNFNIKWIQMCHLSIPVSCITKHEYQTPSPERPSCRCSVIPWSNTGTNPFEPWYIPIPSHHTGWLMGFPAFPTIGYHHPQSIR